VETRTERPDKEIVSVPEGDFDKTNGIKGIVALKKHRRLTEEKTDREKG